MPWIDWYNSLAKPSWTPAPSTIGLIWQILYPIILVSFGFVFEQAIRKKSSLARGAALRHQPCGEPDLHAVQFGMRNLPLAAVDMGIKAQVTVNWQPGP